MAIKKLEHQYGQMLATYNHRQPGTLPSKIIANQINNGHCHAITTQSGKTTTDLPTPTIDEQNNNDDAIYIESSNKQDTEKGKTEETVLNPISRPCPVFLQRIKKK